MFQAWQGASIENLTDICEAACADGATASMVKRMARFGKGNRKNASRDFRRWFKHYAFELQFGCLFTFAFFCTPLTGPGLLCRGLSNPPSDFRIEQKTKKFAEDCFTM
jgi:hypothetical protein